MTTMREGGIDVMIDGMTNKGSCAFILSSLILEPRLHLPLGELEGKGKNLAISWKEIVLFLKPPLENLDLFWGKPHSPSLWGATGPVRLMLICPLWTASRLIIEFFVVVAERHHLFVACMCICNGQKTRLSSSSHQFQVITATFILNGIPV